MGKINIYSQTPVTFTSDSYEYINHIIELAKMTEKYHYTGMLIRYGEDKIDPWILSFKVMENTESLIPLIAVQEDMLPPLTTAKMAYGTSFVYNRQIHFNLISGTEKQLKNNIAPENRYAGLIEYVELSKALLNRSLANQSYSGEYYSYRHEQSFIVDDNYRFMPKFYVSGTSQIGLAAAQKSADGFLTVAPTCSDFTNLITGCEKDIELGICLGIITRPTKEEAMEVAKLVFVTSRESEIKARMKRNSKISSIRYLANLAVDSEMIDGVYWLGAFMSDQSIYPYLVGSYSDVSAYINKYIDAGVTSLILCTKPATEEEFYHNDQMFKLIDSIEN